MDTLQIISFDEAHNIKRAWAEYAIYSDTLNPDDLSLALKVEPDRAWAKGDIYIGKYKDVATGEVKVTERQRQSGIWAIHSMHLKDITQAEQHVEYLLNLLQPSSKYMTSLLASGTCRVHFYVHWEPADEYGSYTLSSSVLSRMASLSHYTEYWFST